MTESPLSGKRTGPFLFLLAFFVCAAGLWSPASAQVKPPRASQREIIRERNVYIPYKKLQDTFERRPGHFPSVRGVPRALARGAAQAG